MPIAPKLSVIIPAYNEAKRLPKTLQAVSQYLSRQNYDYEIIVVNDGSKDNTAQVARDTIPGIDKLRLIDNKENHGKGYAVRQGLLAAQGQYRLFTDADNSTSIDQIEKMWPWFEKGYDIVIGSRDLPESVIAVRQPWFREQLGNVFNLIVQVVAGLWGMWDTQAGFKAFTAKAVQDIFPKAKINRWAFDVEILVLAKKMGYKIKEAPIVWLNDPESKVKLMGAVNMLWEVARIRWRLWSRQYEL